MPDIRVIGQKELVLGFQLAGVKEVIDVSRGNPESVFRRILAEAREGIVITDDTTISQIGHSLRLQIETSVKPVFVVLSEGEAGKEALRDMIRKSIGVDVSNV